MNSKKKKMIQPRPVPPDLDSIRSDLENAPHDDVAFTFFNVVSNDMNSPSTESSSERVVAADLDKNSEALKTSVHSAATESSSSLATSGSSKKHSADLDKCYSQTLKFIEMNNYLKDSQERVAEQCNGLQELGKSVAEQVEMLRVQLS